MDNAQPQGQTLQSQLSHTVQAMPMSNQILSLVRTLEMLCDTLGLQFRLQTQWDRNYDGNIACLDVKSHGFLDKEVDVPECEKYIYTWRELQLKHSVAKKWLAKKARFRRSSATDQTFEVPSGTSVSAPTFGSFQQVDQVIDAEEREDRLQCQTALQSSGSGRINRPVNTDEVSPRPYSDKRCYSQKRRNPEHSDFRVDDVDTADSVESEVLDLLTVNRKENAPPPPKGFDRAFPGMACRKKAEARTKSRQPVKDFLITHKELFGFIVFDRCDDNSLKIFDIMMNEEFPPGPQS